MAPSIRLALTAIAVVGLLHPAHAATAEQCQALLGSVPLAHDQPAKAEPVGTDGCRFTGVRFAFGPRFGYEIGSLVERGIPFGPLRVPDKRLDVRIEAHDVVLVLHTGLAKTDWLSRQQQVPFTIVLDGSFDPSTREIVLRDLSMDGRAIGQTSLAAVIVDANAGTFPEKVGVRSLKVHLDSRRFIVAFLLAPMLSVLPDDDPAGALERAKSQAAAILRAALVQSRASPETIAAVTGFIADFPHPQHVFDVSVAAPTPVLLETLTRAAVDPASLSVLLRTLMLTASYAGEPR